MFEVKIFPIYGAALGLNYWNSEMDTDEELKEITHIVQVFIFIFGFSIIWYKS